MPAPLRPLIKIIARRQTRSNLVGQGLGRVKPEEHRKMLGDSLDWLDNIADGAFLCGKELSMPMSRLRLRSLACSVHSHQLRTQRPENGPA